MFKLWNFRPSPHPSSTKSIDQRWLAAQTRWSETTTTNALVAKTATLSEFKEPRTGSKYFCLRMLCDGTRAQWIPERFLEAILVSRRAVPLLTGSTQICHTRDTTFNTGWLFLRQSKWTRRSARSTEKMVPADEEVLRPVILIAAKNLRC